MLGVLLAEGCAQFVSPIPPPPHRDRVAASYDATWGALIKAFADENLPIRAIGRDSGIIASDDVVTPIGLYADCGRFGDKLVEGEALVSFTIFVRPNGNDTDVQINTKMRTQAYRKGSSGKLRPDQVIQCASTGRFESNLLDAVRSMVKQ